MAFERLDDAFIIRHANLKTWNCLKFGFDHKWIGVPALATIADGFVTNALADEELLCAFELSQCGGSGYQTASDLLSKLCTMETQRGNDVGDCWRLWLLLGLLWLYAHERFIKDPLFLAEDLVDDLAIVLEGRPKEATGWLRFMPIDAFEDWNPMHHSREQNYQRLMGKWKTYLIARANEYLKDFDAILPAARQG